MPPSDAVTRVAMQSKRGHRAQLMQKVQHLLPAALLLNSAFVTFSRGEEGTARIIAVVQAVAALAFIVTVARAVRQARAGHGGHGHHGVDWADIFVAGVFFAEGLERYHVRHKLIQPAFVTAAAMLLLGLFHGRIFSAAERRRSLTIGPDGVSVGRRPFGTFRATWDNLKAIDIDDRYATITRRDGGQRRIDLHDVVHPEPVRRALEEARTRMTPV
jgi:hypothetical protein